MLNTLRMLDLELARIVEGRGNANFARELVGCVETHAIEYGLAETDHITHAIATCKCLHSRQADAFRADLRKVYPDFF